jgi:hypothetical protein
MFRSKSCFCWVVAQVAVALVSALAPSALANRNRVYRLPEVVALAEVIATAEIVSTRESDVELAEEEGGDLDVVARIKWGEIIHRCPDPDSTLPGEAFLQFRRNKHGRNYTPGRYVVCAIQDHPGVFRVISEPAYGVLPVSEDGEIRLPVGWQRHEANAAAPLESSVDEFKEMVNACVLALNNKVQVCDVRALRVVEPEGGGEPRGAFYRLEFASKSCPGAILPDEPAWRFRIAGYCPRSAVDPARLRAAVGESPYAEVSMSVSGTWQSGTYLIESITDGRTGAELVRVAASQTTESTAVQETGNTRVKNPASGPADQP